MPGKRKRVYAPRPSYSRKRHRAARRIQRHFRKRRKYKRRRKGLRGLASRVRQLESASQLKRSYTTISAGIINDNDLTGVAFDAVPISTVLTTDAYGRQANSTKVVGKKFEIRMRYYATDDTPEKCDNMVMLCRSALESPTVPGQIDPPHMAQLYDLANLPALCSIPQWRMFKLPGSLTDVYQNVQILKTWHFMLGCDRTKGTGEIDNNLGATATTTNEVFPSKYPVQKWINHTVDLKGEVFKFASGTATVPIGPFRYFLMATSTCSVVNHEQILCSGVIKFTYKDD